MNFYSFAALIFYETYSMTHLFQWNFTQTPMNELAFMFQYGTTKKHKLSYTDEGKTLEI